MNVAKRHAVTYRHDALHPEFLQFMAAIAGYAGEKYGAPLQYLDSRLVGSNGPVNHARNHIGEFQMGKEHDHFGSDIRWHLAAAAYNLMMEFAYITYGCDPDIWPLGIGATYTPGTAEPEPEAVEGTPTPAADLYTQKLEDFSEKLDRKIMPENVIAINANKIWSYITNR